MCHESAYRFGGHHGESVCKYPGHHGMGEHWHQSRGCCCRTGHDMRQFPTKEEMIAEMEEYLKQLRAEAKGVEEHLADLKKMQA